MRHALQLAIVSTCLLSTWSAHAQHRNDADMRDRFGARLLFGLGGEAEYDTDVSVNVPILGPVGGRGNVDDDMETSVGLGLSYESPFHQYVTAGALLELLSWNSDAREDANIDAFTLVNLDAFIKLRFPTHLGKMGFEPYAMLPLGFTMNFPGDDDPDDLSTGFGWNTGLLFGGILFVSDAIGINGEIGYRAHAMSHEIDTEGSDPDVDISTGQMAFNIGVTIALD